MTKIKVLPLIDEEGSKLPKNMAQQFRNVQSNLEHLKFYHEDLIVEMKGVNSKLKTNTTDLKLVVEKVNEIDKNLKNHIKSTSDSFKGMISFLERLTNAIENMEVRDIKKNNGKK